MLTLYIRYIWRALEKQGTLEDLSESLEDFMHFDETGRTIKKIKEIMK